MRDIDILVSNNQRVLDELAEKRFHSKKFYIQFASGDVHNGVIYDTNGYEAGVWYKSTDNYVDIYMNAYVSRSTAEKMAHDYLTKAFRAEEHMIFSYSEKADFWFDVLSWFKRNQTEGFLLVDY